MPGLLDGQLARTIYQGFRNKLLTGQLRKAVPSISGGLLPNGDPIATAIVLYTCQGFVEGYSAIYKARAGIPETDSKVNVFAASLPAGVRPEKDDKVKFLGTWWQLRKAETDPATALWTCQAYQCTPPPP